jgi:hypothetical protein
MSLKYFNLSKHVFLKTHYGDDDDDDDDGDDDIYLLEIGFPLGGSGR